MIPRRLVVAGAAMLDASTLHGLLVGPVAARVLRAGTRGTVCAVFDRSIYVSLDSGCICVGPIALDAGPLNLLCKGWFTARPISAPLQVGDAVWVESDVLRIGPLAISFAAAQPWHPQPPGTWNRTSLAYGLAAFADALPRSLPDEGLAPLLYAELRTAGAISPVAAAAKSPIRYLTQLLQGAKAEDGGGINAEQIAPLIGLGPGLTPSGDDYLGGMLVALSLIGQISLRDKLWQLLKPLLACRTGDISRAHLAAAAEGYGCSALHDLLCAIITGATDAIPAAITSVTAIGHTSGWDALFGAVTVLRARNPNLTATRGKDRHC